MRAGPVGTELEAEGIHLVGSKAVLPYGQPRRKQVRRYLEFGITRVGAGISGASRRACPCARGAGWGEAGGSAFWIPNTEVGVTGWPDYG